MEAELTELAGSDDSFLATRARLSDELQPDPSGPSGGGEGCEPARGLNPGSGKPPRRERPAELALRENIDRLKKANEEHEQSIRAIQEEKEKSAGRIREAEEAIRKAAEERMQKEGSISRESQRQRAVSDERER